MKKKSLKVITVAALCAAIFIALAVPCFAFGSSSSRLNKTTINLESVLYTDASSSANYFVSGFDFGVDDLNNDLTGILYTVNDENTGYIGTNILANYFSDYVDFHLTPRANGTSNGRPYYYPRMFYFGDSYLDLKATTWGAIQFQYNLISSSEDVQKESIFCSVTYSKPVIGTNGIVRFENETVYGTFPMTPFLTSGHIYDVYIKDIVEPLIDTTGLGNIVHIESLKFTRVTSADSLCIVDACAIRDLSYYQTDGDDLSPQEIRYQDYLNATIGNDSLNADFTSWITVALGSFLNFQIIPGISFWSIFLGILGILVLIAFLKYFAGG